MGLSWLRQRVLVLVLVLVMVMVTSSAIELNGDNVCHRVENYTVSIKESFTEPVIVNTVTWCLEIPPRCPRSRVEMRIRWRIKTETRQRKLTECCEGYVVKTSNGGNSNVEDSETGECEPRCETCEYGRCIAPNTCECELGHRGDGCAYECPAGTWGVRCSQTCNCESVEVCNPINGNCHCPPGWRGSGCKEKCPAGKWGLDCALPCACNHERDGHSGRSPLVTRELSSVCHHETGNCIDFEQTIVSSIPELGNWTKSKEKNKDTSNVTAAFVPSPTTKSMPIGQIESSTSNSDYGNDVTDDSSENDDNIDPRGDRVAAELPRPTERGIADYDDYKQSVNIGGSLSETSPNRTVLKIGTIEASSNATSTGTNNNSNYNDEQQRAERIDMKVSKVKKPSTPRPIVAVLHVSGNGSPGHDGPMIMTSLGAEKIPTHAAPMPLDVAALIVVGSIISLGLTTLAVLAVLHIRSRLFETIRLSIYDATEKRDATTNGTMRRGGGEKGNTGRISSLGCNSGIIACEYETPRCIVPEHQTLPRPRPASCTDTPKKQESNYSNDFANIRLFSNIQELLEAHYDRPPSTFRHAVVEVNNEHVYDEIPLQSSTTFTTKRDS